MVLLISNNDVGPRGKLQLFFVSLVILSGLLIIALIFGNIGVLVQNFSRKSTLFLEKIDNASEAMINLRLPEDVRKNVELYLSYTFSASDHQKELDSFLSMLSPSLKQKVTNSIFRDYVFKNQKEIQDAFLNHLSIKLFLPEDQIIQQGGDSESMYFIARGACNIYVTDHNRNEILANTISEGSYFGEVGLVKR